MNLKVSVFGILFFGAHLMSAQTCCSGGIPLSNSIGLPMLERGTTQLGIYYDYNNLNTLNSGTKKLDDDSRLRITNSVLFNFSYAITNNLSVEGLLTWVQQKREITQFNSRNLDESSGIGDGVLLMKYQFPTKKVASTFNVGLGTKIPFGSSTEKNNLGIVLNADLQPGSNAWDLIYWSSYVRSFDFRPSLNIGARFIYRSTGENDSYFGDSVYKFGNEFLAFLSFSDQFLVGRKMIAPSVSLKYRNAIKDKIGGFDLENTGGQWISIIPNFSVNLGPNVLFSTKVEIPVLNDVKGTQLTPTYRLTSGLLFKLTSKQLLLN